MDIRSYLLGRSSAGGSGGGGGSSIDVEPLSITKNGEYTAAEGKAYSPITVNVPSSGASNVVFGSFTGEASGKPIIPLAYTGNGYPLSVAIWPDEGFYNTNGAMYNSNMDYVPLLHCIVKSVGDSVPTYTDTGAENEGAVIHAYKKSTVGSVNIAGITSAIAHYNVFTNSSASHISNVQICKLHSATEMEVQIKSQASSAYGFPAGVKYNYVVVYSS